MILVFDHPFGRFVPGDEIEVPDGAEYDHTYCHEKPKAKASASTSNPSADTPAGEEK